MPEWFVWTVKYCVKYSQASAENRVLHLALKKKLTRSSLWLNFLWIQNFFTEYTQNIQTTWACSLWTCVHVGIIGNNALPLLFTPLNLTQENFYIYNESRRFHSNQKGIPYLRIFFKSRKRIKVLGKSTHAKVSLKNAPKHLERWDFSNTD